MPCKYGHDDYKTRPDNRTQRPNKSGVIKTCRTCKREITKAAIENCKAYLEANIQSEGKIEFQNGFILITPKYVEEINNLRLFVEHIPIKMKSKKVEKDTYIRYWVLPDIPRIRRNVLEFAELYRFNDR